MRLRTESGEIAGEIICTVFSQGQDIYHKCANCLVTNLAWALSSSAESELHGKPGLS